MISTTHQNVSFYTISYREPEDDELDEPATETPDEPVLDEQDLEENDLSEDEVEDIEWEPSDEPDEEINNPDKDLNI